MKKYLQYIKENMSLDGDSRRDTPLKKEIHKIYQMMSHHETTKFLIFSKKVIDLLSKYIDDFEIDIDDRRKCPYKHNNKEHAGWIISFNIKDEYFTGSFSMPFAVDYYFDENYNLIYFNFSSDDYPSVFGNRIGEIQDIYYKDVLQILRNYFEENPQKIGKFPIQKLFPDYNHDILKLKEWS